MGGFRTCRGRAVTGMALGEARAYHDPAGSRNADHIRDMPACIPRDTRLMPAA